MGSLKILSNKLLCIFLIYIFHSTFLQAQWFQQTNGLPDNWSYSDVIDACDNQTAVISIMTYTTNNSQLFKTIDAGQTWFEIPNPNAQTSRVHVIDLSLVDSTHLWICTAYPAKIFSTENNGATWEEQFYDSTMTDFINYIEMFDLNNGIAMGDAIDWGAGPAIFLRTTDGGANWVSVNDSAFGGSSGDIWRRVDFVNPDVGYFFESGSNPQLLFKTFDGGYNWDALPYPANYIMVLKFYDENIGYAINWDADYYTFDAGQTWTEIPDTTDGWGTDIEYCPEDPSKVWKCELGSSGAFFSSDSGKTWSEQTGITAPRDIVFVDAANGWILGDVGVYHTTSGGHILTITEINIPHNTESTGPFSLEFSIEETGGIWTDQRLFHYTIEDIHDSLALIYMPQDNVWQANLPEFSGITGTTELQYWLSIEQTTGNYYTWPIGAPANSNTIVFGPDTTGPVLDELSTQSAAHYLIPFEKEIRIDAVWDDRFALDTPVLHYRVNQGTEESSLMDWIDSTFANETWLTSWKGVVTGQTGNLHDTVYYWVTASDMSQNQNMGVSQTKHFTTAKVEVIGDWEQAESYEDISLWTPFSYGSLYDYNSGDYQWGTVIKESMNVLDAFRDTLRYERRLNFSHVEDAWLRVPMIINFGQYNEGYLQVSTNGGDWTNLDHYVGQVPPTVYQYDLSEYAGEDSIYFLFHVMHWDANLNWLIDDIILYSDSTLVSLEDYLVIADQFQLHQNYPNPFNPITTIQYNLPERSNVQITIYNLLGRKVATLLSETQDTGSKSVRWDATNVASGVYFYQIRAGEFVQTRKMVMLK